MDVIEAIRARRSIRRFKTEPVPRALVERLLEAATLAPSGKNLQPWSFLVLEGEKKNRAAAILLEIVERRRIRGEPTGSAEASARVMTEAPVTILVYDRVWRTDLPGPPGIEDPEPITDDGIGNRPLNIVDLQSIGAAIQNMLLAAQDLGLGTLWICDALLAHEEIGGLVGRQQALIAAIAVGYPAESPGVRPRRHWRELTEWMGR